MDEFTSRVEELNSKFTVKKHLPSQQNLALPNDACNGSTPTNLFLSVGQWYSDTSFFIVKPTFKGFPDDRRGISLCLLPTFFIACWK